MKIIYAGYREWSYKILENLLKEKKLKIEFALVPKEAEMDFNKIIKVVKVDPENLNAKKNFNKISQVNPAAILFYGWSWMIPKAIYKNYTCLILHPSKLPKYRGGSPIQNQIINGERESAVSIIQAVEKVDAGPIFAQVKFSLEGSLSEILERIVKAGTKASLKVLEDFSKGKKNGKKQNEKTMTVFKRRKPEDGEITPKDLRIRSGKQLYDLIRALQDPYPNAYIKGRDGKKVFIKSAVLEK